MGTSTFGVTFASQHGCAWFSEGVGGSGWYSVAGLPAEKFESRSELPKGVTWWSNLTKAEVWAAGEWSRIKEADVFGLSWSGWVPSSDDERVPAVCAAVSEVFTRIGFWLNEWSLPARNTPWDWSSDTPSEKMSEVLGSTWVKDSPQSVFLSDFPIRPLRHPVQPVANSLPSMNRLILAFPRRLYAEKMLAVRHPSPDAQWSQVSRDLWPSAGMLSAFFGSQPSPLAVRIESVHPRSGKETELGLWLGDRGCRFLGADRGPFWVTGGEARDLSSIATFSVLSVWRAEQWSSEVGFPGFDEDGWGPLSDFSLCADILAATVWRAAMSPSRGGPQSLRGVWMAAADRRECHSAALSLAESGFHVSWYGSGEVCVLFDRDMDRAHMVRSISEAGLSLPASLSGEFLAQTPPMSVLSVDAWIKASSTLEMRLDIDRMVLPWRDGTPYKPVLREATNRLAGIDAPSPEWREMWLGMIRDQVSIAASKFVPSAGQ